MLATRVVLDVVHQVVEASGPRRITTTIISELSGPSFYKPTNIPLIQPPPPRRQHILTLASHPDTLQKPYQRLISDPFTTGSGKQNPNPAPPPHSRLQRPAPPPPPQ